MAIETVQIRSQGAYDFSTHYESLCALQNSVPVASVKAHLGVGVIDVNADKIRLSDWLPLLKTVRINKTLKCIAFRSFYEMPWNKLASGLDRKKVLPAASRKVPSVHSKEVTYPLCKALRECLEVTQALEYIELQGLTLRRRDVAELMKGVGRNFTLKHLSFEGSRLEESSVHVICEGMKNASSLTYLNLSGCGLTSQASEAIARVVKHQAMMRHSEAWKNSLRYRVPDLNCMPGLRRITLNHNPLLGDETASIFADTLKDDLWLKAVDLQHCGVTASGAQLLLDALRFNTTVVVLDVRNNPLVGRELTQKITEQVLLNAGASGGGHSEYKWLRATEVQSGATAESGTRAQPRVPPLRAIGPPLATVKPSSGSSRGKRRGLARSLTSTHVPQHRGLPWRTAQRALLHRGASLAPLSARSADQWEDVASDSGGTGADDTSSGTGSGRSTASSSQGIARIRPVARGDGGAVGDAAELMASACPSEPLTVDQLTDVGGGGSLPLLSSSSRGAATEMKRLRVEVEQLRRQMLDEAAARRAAEEQVLELSRENRRLQQQRRQQDAPLLAAAGSLRKGCIEVDEDFLDSVERSFAQYNAFLDVLRDAGLGELVEVAGFGGSAVVGHHGSVHGQSAAAAAPMGARLNGRAQGRHPRHHRVTTPLSPTPASDQQQHLTDAAVSAAAAHSGDDDRADSERSPNAKSSASSRSARQAKVEAASSSSAGARSRSSEERRRRRQGRHGSAGAPASNAGSGGGARSLADDAAAAGTRPAADESSAARSDDEVDGQQRSIVVAGAAEAEAATAEVASLRRHAEAGRAGAPAPGRGGDGGRQRGSGAAARQPSQDSRSLSQGSRSDKPSSGSGAAADRRASSTSSAAVSIADDADVRSAGS